jgi:hypothetical protein
MFQDGETDNMDGATVGCVRARLSLDELFSPGDIPIPR